MDAPNRNLLWAKLFVDELARSGLRAVCIAPGSRSTPLTVAFAEHPDITVYSHIDERSAAFFALGHALATDRPVALLCSSGTATANFFPAIIEARYSQVPLLILTADRPPELRDSGANQTVDQVKLYGDHVLWSVDVAVPEAVPAPLTIRSLRTLANRAYNIANGMPHGVVHLNFPFRKPLEPTPVPTDQTQIADERPAGIPFTRFERGVMQPTDAQVEMLATAIAEAERPLIVCGPRCPAGLAEVLDRLSNNERSLPVMADPLSGVRYFQRRGDSLFLSGYDMFLRAGEFESPDLILHFGAMPTSQALEDYLARAKDARRIVISPDGVWKDANHQTETFIWADPVIVCERLLTALDRIEVRQHEHMWHLHFMLAETAVHDVIEAARSEALFDGLAVESVIAELPSEASLFVANSLPVRHLDQFGVSKGRALRVFCNRGASGIDGTISSALGAAAGSDKRLVLITGDLAFYHDLNGLLAVKRCGVKATIVLLNNNGGGIFRRLPIAQFDPPFTDLFVTPHGLDFEPVVRMYGLDYTKVTDREAFRDAFNRALRSDTATVIEVPTDSTHDEARRQDIIRRVGELLKQALAQNTPQG